MADRLILSGPAFARLVASSPSAIRRLAASGVLKRSGPGERAGFDVEHNVPLYIEHLRKGGGDSGNFAEARLRLLDAQCRDIEQRTRHRAAKLLDVDAVAQAMDAAVGSLGAALDGLPGRVASELASIHDPAGVREVLFRECRALRNEMATRLDEIASGKCAAGACAEPDAAAGVG